jgi:hypothetical protein
MPSFASTQRAPARPTHAEVVRALVGAERATRSCPRPKSWWPPVDPHLQPREATTPGILFPPDVLSPCLFPCPPAGPCSSHPEVLWAGFAGGSQGGRCPARTGDLLLVSSIPVGGVVFRRVRFAHFATISARPELGLGRTNPKFRKCLFPASVMGGPLLPQAHLPVKAPRSDSAVAAPGRTPIRPRGQPDQQASRSVPGAEGSSMGSQLALRAGLQPGARRSPKRDRAEALSFEAMIETCGASR